MKSSPQSSDWREERRLRAWALHEQGWKQSQIAEALGVSQGAISQWIARVRTSGIEALRNRKSLGAPRRLTHDQREQLPRILERGAEAFGFRGTIWTRARIAAVIEREFGVSYHYDHIGRMLKDIGWSVRKPLERITQRDEAAIPADVTSADPRSKKSGQQGTLMWVNEAGFPCYWYCCARATRPNANRAWTASVPIVFCCRQYVAALVTY